MKTLIRSDGRIDFRAFSRRVAMEGERIEPFSSPIAIVIDRLSASTSEMLASGMQAAGRATFRRADPGHGTSGPDAAAGQRGHADVRVR